MNFTPIVNGMAQKILSILLLCTVFISCSKNTVALMYDESSYELRSIPEKKLPADTLGWSFPEELVDSLTEKLNGVEELPLSLTATIAATGIERCTIALLYPEGKTGPGAQITTIPESEDGREVTVAIAIGLGNVIPQGVVLQYKDFPAEEKSGESLKAGFAVKEFAITTMKIGWSRYPSVSFYFNPKGGSAKYSEICPGTFDFSDDISDNTVLNVVFEPQPVLHETQQIVDLSVGTELVHIRQSPAVQTVHLYPALFRNNATRVSVVSNKSLVSSLFYTSVDSRPNKPIAADPGIILTWPKNTWANPDYQLYRWEQFPQVLLFDFADYGIQDEMLKRLAFFTEKAGYKGRLASDDEIQNLHGYNAHDYRSESLAAFFNTAAEEQFPLNRYELELRDILVTEGLLIPQSVEGQPPYRSGTGAIISISQESAYSLRWQLLTHEAYHGIFFTDEKFQKYVAEVYDTMDAKSREFLLLYFKTQSSLGYDTSDLFLMHTELLSYLLQQGKSACADYFVRRSNYKSMFTADEPLCDYIRDTNAQGMVEAHQKLEEYVFTHYGLKGGRVNLIER